MPKQLALSRNAAVLVLMFVAYGAAQGQQATQLTTPNPTATAVNSEQARIADCRIGFENCYKVGFWTPIWVDAIGVAGSDNARIEVTVVDNDGVQTTLSKQLASDSAADTITTLLYTKVGRTNAPIRIALVANGTVVDRKELDPRRSSPEAPVLDALPATSELVLSFAGGANGLSDALADHDSADHAIARRAVEIQSAADLPDAWFGYEAVDLVVLSGSDVELCQSLASDDTRLAALERWVKLGGRLMILCGGKQAESLFAAGQPLAKLLPGTLSETVRLTETTALEHFAEAPEPIVSRRGARTELAVPKLTDIQGNIEVYAGRLPTDLPIVIRAPFGLGEVTFAGLDLAAPPIQDWAGRDALWQALLRPYVEAAQDDEGPLTLGTLGYNDLSGALRQRLGRSFASVTTVTFPIVALLVILYLALLGPAHYWLVHHYGGRPGLAWVVFPLLVLFTSAVAFWIGQRSKGGAPRVNQLELVDFDMTTGQARGAYWAALYSPESRTFDLKFSTPGRPAAQSVSPEILFSWWGLPGVGVGGMHAGSLDLAAIDAGYRYSDSRNALLGVPVLTSSTKSVMARWVAPTEETVHADLTDDDGMVAGTIVNNTAEALRDARLLYGAWAYRLGDLPSGRQVDIGQQLSPITVNTLLMRDAGARNAADRGKDRSSFFVDRASTDELLAVMMFYRAAGGENFASLPNRYQAYCDLSRLLELGRAVLVADVERGGGQLVDPSSGQPIDADKSSHELVYRFVLPVDRD